MAAAMFVGLMLVAGLGWGALSVAHAWVERPRAASATHDAALADAAALRDEGRFDDAREQLDVVLREAAGPQRLRAHELARDCEELALVNRRLELRIATSRTGAELDDVERELTTQRWRFHAATVPDRLQARLDHARRALER